MTFGVFSRKVCVINLLTSIENYLYKGEAPNMLCVVCTSVRVCVCVFVVRRARVIELVGHTNHIH